MLKKWNRVWDRELEIELARKLAGVLAGHLLLTCPGLAAAIELERTVFSILGSSCNAWLGRLLWSMTTWCTQPSTWYALLVRCDICVGGVSTTCVGELA